ncbi:pyruvate ferredoxin oxidoreductase [candidate division TA06 bacterium DG_26]|uniref:Pyruvate ferredoxin oxidoreductase n=1 Tax=candidate division TA06 bacterium DG_26 TaxID=1703771 RepID=A0A0S7WLH6_UNCT6|nr:MAG: pyruvate ferredoxin oxidoreductase [candidate division TA06 bacterium DG_26]
MGALVVEIRFSGFGGQGIIRSGYIVGRAAAIFDNKEATMTQSFGPEARGSACSSQLLVSDEKILYPYITQPDILVAMSQEAYDKFEPELKAKGILIIDEDLVKISSPRDDVKFFSVPATRIAEELGNRIVANLVMLGFFTAVVAGVVSADAMKKAIPESVPKRFLELNLKAFDRGFEYSKPKKPTGAEKSSS